MYAKRKLERGWDSEVNLCDKGSAHEVIDTYVSWIHGYP